MNSLHLPSSRPSSAAGSYEDLSARETVEMHEVPEPPIDRRSAKTVRGPTKTKHRKRASTGSPIQRDGHAAGLRRLYQNDLLVLDVESSFVFQIKSRQRKGNRVITRRDSTRSLHALLFHSFTWFTLRWQTFPNINLGMLLLI